MADAKITVDVKTNFPEIKKAVAQVAGEAGGLSKVLENMNKMITKSFSIQSVLDFGKNSMLAAQAAGAYTGEIDSLAVAFQTLQVSVGKALLPILNAVAPSVNMAIMALNGLVSIFAQVMSLLFAGGQGVAEGGDQAAKSTASAGSAAKKASKEMKGILASFDALNVLEDNSGDGAEAAIPGVLAPNDMDTSGVDNMAVYIVSKLQEAADSVGQYFHTNLADAFNGAIGQISISASGLLPIFQQVWSDIVSLGAPLKAWFDGSFTTHLQTWITTIGGILSGLLDTFGLVFSDIWNIILAPLLESWAVDILPLLTDIGTLIFTTIGTLFENIKLLFDTLWTEGIAPALEMIQTIWFGLWESIVAAWEEHGQPIFDGIQELIGNVANTLLNVWETIIKPVWDKLIEVLTRLWNEHLKPLWDNLLDFIGSFAEMALAAYNNFILPIVNWLIDVFGPAFAETFGGVLETVGKVVGGIADFIGKIIETITGVITFLTSVFSADWAAIWQGIVDSFSKIFGEIGDFIKGVINSGIDAINGMMSALGEGVNFIIRALNKISFTIPDWVPVFGGQTWGFNLKPFVAPQIPRLARGAVIPPNREFMAVLGDQSRGMNIETPEGLLRQIFREEAGSSAVVSELREILSAIREGKVLTVDKRVLGRTVQEMLADSARAGGMAAVPVR